MNQIMSVLIGIRDVLACFTVVPGMIMLHRLRSSLAALQEAYDRYKDAAGERCLYHKERADNFERALNDAIARADQCQREADQCREEIDRRNSVILVNGRHHFLLSDPGPERFPLCPRCMTVSKSIVRLAVFDYPDSQLTRLECPVCDFREVFPFHGNRGLFASAESAIAEKLKAERPA